MTFLVATQAVIVSLGVVVLWVYANPRRTFEKWQRLYMLKPARWLDRTVRIMRKERKEEFRRYQHPTKVLGSTSERQFLRWAVNINNAEVAEENRGVRRRMVAARIVIVALTALNIYLWFFRG